MPERGVYFSLGFQFNNIKNDIRLLIVMRKKFNRKISELASNLPADFNGLKLITINELLCDTKKSPPKAIDFLSKKKDLLTQIEGLNQFHSEYYKKNIPEASAFNKAIFYSSLWSLVIFREIWAKFIDEFDKFDINNLSTIKKINEVMNSNQINKIRNSIAHLDVDINQENIKLNDNKYTKNYTIIECVSLASWLLTILIIVAHNESLQRI